MNIHIIQHEVFEAPGAISEWAKERNYHTTISKVFEYESLPQSTDRTDMLVVMGGPQSPRTSRKECSYFDARAEMAFIQKCMEAGKAVFGVCLGAQLIGEALGAKAERSPEKEIGVFPVKLTDDGLKDGKIRHFGPSLPVGHWHSDMPGLTADSRILASSTGCPRQIIAYSGLVYGFQCHMELTPEVVDLLIAEDEDFLTHNTTHRFVQKPEAIRSNDFTEMNADLFRFLDQLMLEYRQKTIKNFHCPEKK
ncbi:glutamine amidotransferase [Sinomicrobium soli]|nr:glutamine amidotransferase [Sinomicrobium sp. N-1-3-6]